MMLPTGPAEVRVNYVRTPRVDDDGKLTEYVYPTRVEYEVLGGTQPQRRTRAKRLAKMTGGIVLNNDERGYYPALTTTTPELAGKRFVVRVRFPKGATA